MKFIKKILSFYELVKILGSSKHFLLKCILHLKI